jgi:dihydroorotate dehydrogenase (fumarate)
MTEIDFGVDLAGIHLEHPVMNAAGTCKTISEARELVRSNSAAILIGSITIERRMGNAGEILWIGDDYSMNSVGLANDGAAYTSARLIPEIIAAIHKSGKHKPLFVSVAGFKIGEYVALVESFISTDVDFIELDLSCSNIWELEGQGSIFCFSPILTRKILKRIEARAGTDVKIGVKISPFSDPSGLRKIAGIISQFKVVKAVTTMNTFPNALSFDEKGCPRTAPADGLAGLGGPAIKSIALGQIKQLRSLLPRSIDIIGVGGISHGKDIVDFRLAGATAVQIGTLLLRHSPKDWPDVFTRLLIEYSEEIEKRNLQL